MQFAAALCDVDAGRQQQLRDLDAPGGERVRVGHLGRGRVAHEDRLQRRLVGNKHVRKGQ